MERVVCAVRGTDNALYSIVFNPFTGSPQGFKKLEGVTIIGNPSCAEWGPVIECGVVDTRNTLFVIALPSLLTDPDAFPAGELRFKNLGAVTIANPTCASGGLGVLCMVVGLDSALVAFCPGPRQEPDLPRGKLCLSN
jgi:hypothetical protein